jgi:hypothetical protein
MAVLIGAVVLVGALCLLNLLLTFGVIRRLREHTEMLARNSPGALGALGAIGLTAGESPETFSATDDEGAVVRGPSGLRVVAFFSTSCSICPKRAPAFVDYVRGQLVGRDEVLAVVVGQSADSVPYLAQLTEVARVSTESPDGPAGRAFAVQGYPAFFALDAAGTVVWSGYDPAALPAPAAV